MMIDDCERSELSLKARTNKYKAEAGVCELDFNLQLGRSVGLVDLGCSNTHDLDVCFTVIFMPSPV
jgi:hypothetical protein